MSFAPGQTWTGGLELAGSSEVEFCKAESRKPKAETTKGQIRIEFQLSTLKSQLFIKRLVAL